MATQADAQLKSYRIAIHDTIDPIWRSGGSTGRKPRRQKLYDYLAQRIGVDEFHVGFMNKQECIDLIAWLGTQSRQSLLDACSIKYDEKIHVSGIGHVAKKKKLSGFGKVRIRDIMQRDEGVLNAPVARIPAQKGKDKRPPRNK